MKNILLRIGSLTLFGILFLSGCGTSNTVRIPESQSNQVSSTPLVGQPKTAAPIICSDQDCFEKNFANCTSAVYENIMSVKMSASGPSFSMRIGKTRHEIVGPQGKQCQTKHTVLEKNPGGFPIPGTLEMTCLYDNTKKLALQTDWNAMAQSLKKNNGCNGSLAEFLVGNLDQLEK